MMYGKQAHEIREIRSHPPVAAYCQKNEAALRGRLASCAMTIDKIQTKSLKGIEGRLSDEKIDSLKTTELLAIAKWASEVHPQHQLTKVQRMEVGSSRHQVSGGISDLLRDADIANKEARAEHRKRIDVVDITPNEEEEVEEAITDAEFQKWDS
jgi:hypothetical protein